MTDIGYTDPLPPFTFNEEARAKYERWLFVKTVADIESRLGHDAEASRYRILGLAPLLRKLIADKYSLIHAPRRAHAGIPLEFRCSPTPFPSPGTSPFPEGVRNLLSAPTADFAQESEHLDLDQFLAATVVWALEEPVTVRDVIRYYAHVEGGVHIGKPEKNSQYEVALHRLSSTVSTLAPAHAMALQTIGNVVVKAVAELRQAAIDAGDGELPNESPFA
ncbi:hypothetical protein [Pseudoclavibacter helvolus]|uniref:hypothetical protein n=1 Tax=Pseudoclavibacter helvolus TaxID=255205 RepID=UPI003734C8BD